ncbi:putative alpha/beta hydrolase [Aspergillus granulosus]|uniref:Alpha/beta hydrolase n=1 Tax=Aspergillus granulosus TaxID=176169 RepID=A0ABR4HBZ1_9EURO
MEPPSATGPEPTAAMIPISTHSLWTALSGPNPPLSASDERSPKCPLVVIVPGAGDVASSYVALGRLLRPSTRVLLYDRSGLGRSERDPTSETPRPNAVRAAKELYTLLTALRQPGPYILVAHSYGGIVAREFLHLHSNDVAGLVLVDCATEQSSELLTFPDPNIVAVMGSLNYARVTGLRQDTVLTDEEWRVRARDIYAGHETAALEAGSFVEVCETLRAKEQLKHQVLGDRPLVVIRANGVRDYERIYEAGVAAGNGTAEQQGAFRELLDRWEGIDKEVQEGQLGLSCVKRLVRLEDCGHNVHLVRPDIVAQEVRWVLERVKANEDLIGDGDF